MKVTLLHGSIDLCGKRTDLRDDPAVLVRHEVQVCPDIRPVPYTVFRYRVEPVEDHVREREPVHVPEDVCGTVDSRDALPVELEVVPRCR